MASVVAALGSNQQPVAIDRARIDRQIRELALEHAAGSLGDDTYLTRLKALREARDAITERTATGVPGQRAVEWLRALSASVWLADVPKEKADLMHAIYERITVAGPEIVGVRLTAAAYAHGLALALPEKVVMARPTGVGRAISPTPSRSRAATSGWPRPGCGHDGRETARLPTSRSNQTTARCPGRVRRMRWIDLACICQPRHPAEHRETPSGRPAREARPNNGAAYLCRPGRRVVAGPEPGAAVGLCARHIQSGS